MFGCEIEATRVALRFLVRASKTACSMMAVGFQAECKNPMSQTDRIYITLDEFANRQMGVWPQGAVTRKVQTSLAGNGSF